MSIFKKIKLLAKLQLTKNKNINLENENNINDLKSVGFNNITHKLELMKKKINQLDESLNVETSNNIIFFKKIRIYYYQYENYEELKKYKIISLLKEDIFKNNLINNIKNHSNSINEFNKRYKDYYSTKKLKVRVITDKKTLYSIYIAIKDHVDVSLLISLGDYRLISGSIINTIVFK